MKFVVFVAVALLGIHSAVAIRCYQCEPDFSNIAGATGNPPTLCGRPNGTITCENMDSCATISVRAKVPIIGDLVVNFLNCTMNSLCNDTIRNATCGGVQQAVNGTGVQIQSCDLTCCKGDLCNNPAPAASSTPSPVSTTMPPSQNTTVTVKSSVTRISFLPNGAIFGILGVITMVFMNLF